MIVQSSRISINWGLHWNSFQCFGTVSRICTEQFMHSIQVSYWNSFQCSCTVLKLHTGTDFNVLAHSIEVVHWNSVLLNISKVFSVSVTRTVYTWNSISVSFYNIHECMVLMFCTGTVIGVPLHDVYPKCQCITGICNVFIQQIYKPSSTSSSEFKDVFQAGHISSSR